MQEQGRCCMWLANKVEIHFAKIGFVDLRWSNLNASGSYTLRCYPLMGYNRNCPFSACREKGTSKCPPKSEWSQGENDLGSFKWDHLDSTKPIFHRVHKTYFPEINFHLFKRHMQQTFVDFIWTVPMPARLGLGWPKPGRIGIAGY